MVAARQDVVAHCEVTDTRLEQASTLITRADGRDEAVPTAEQVLDHVIAPLYYRVAFALPVDEERPRRLVRDVLRMVAPSR